MYKLIDKFKRNAQKRFEEKIEKSSNKSHKQGKNKLKLFLYFKVDEIKIFLKP